jgi:two-component sensor histidine kinase
MRPRHRDILAGIIGALALVLGAAAWLHGQVDPGLTLGIHLAVGGDAGSEIGRIVVVDVTPGGPADQAGLRAGMVVVSLNGRDLTALPPYDPNATIEVDPGNGGAPTTIPLVPDPTPAVVPPADYELGDIVRQEPLEVVAIDPGLLTHPLDPSVSNTVELDVWQWSWPVQDSGGVWLLGLAILAVGGWWLRTGRGGVALRGLAIPLAVATAAPLAIHPLRTLGGPVPMAVSAIVASLALLPLADGLAAELVDGTARLATRGASFGLAIVAAGIGGFIVLPDNPSIIAFLWWVAAFGVTIVPGVLAADRRAAGDPAIGTPPPRRLLESAEFGIAGVTPAMAFVTLLAPTSGLVMPILLWLLAILLAGKFTVRPLARLATRAQFQRDLVVAAMEAERARIATNIHDDALQDVTMIVRRLDEAGDTEGAELARGVADRLRTISGDLRLPILDDLGVGPALDWLVGRTERIAGGEVRLELADGTRPPPEVELAVFRVAQEALTNAVKHGRPPIVVRYRAVDTGVSLSIDDAGPGIGPHAAEEAPAAGHFGILGMSQRAEQIGAILDVRRWPSGGTHVALEWRPR